MKNNKDLIIMYGLLALGAFAMFQVNSNLRAHVKSCEESGKSVRRGLWLVLGAIITEIVIKLVDAHIKF